MAFKWSLQPCRIIDWYLEANEVVKQTAITPNQTVPQDSNVKFSKAKAFSQRNIQYLE